MKTSTFVVAGVLIAVAVVSLNVLHEREAHRAAVAEAVAKLTATSTVTGSAALRTTPVPSASGTPTASDRTPSSPAPETDRLFSAKSLLGVAADVATIVGVFIVIWRTGRGRER